MNRLRVLTLLSAFALSGFARNPVSAAHMAESLGQISLDPEQTFHVRDLKLRRGDVSFYFTDGLLSFATAVEGRRVAAVFSAVSVEAGDAEVLVLPPQAAERQSLANFSHSPNLDEHFYYAILYFTDATGDELLSQIGRAESPKMPFPEGDLRSQAEHVLRSASAQVKTRMVAAILDPTTADKRFFYASVRGRDIGEFDVLYNPESDEPVTLGRVPTDRPGPSGFELWANYRPKNFRPPAPRPSVLSDYKIDATVEPDLSLSAVASFSLAPHAGTGRVIALNLSGRLQVAAATLDGQPVEVFQQVGDLANRISSDSEFLLVTPSPLDSDHPHRIEIRYSGAIISQLAQSSYLVAERNVWYPHTETMLTTFDLVFHCPQQFQIVSTGDLIAEQVEGGIRTVHRKTASPEQMAGFNLGQYTSQSLDSAPYRIQSYEEQALNDNFNGIPEKAAQILRHYTAEWLPLSDKTLAITPVPGDFGQGFPGLIYLARMAYLPDADRPASERAEQNRIFFSDLLLPHEIAHQWWGNMVTPDSYRSEWLMEAMANEAALEFIDASGGAAVKQSVMERYRTDLATLIDGKTIESVAPVDFGSRILTTSGLPAWQTILYKKGTWILEMLRARMGSENFIKMQTELLRARAGKPVSNEDFRGIAAHYIPANQPDRDLQLFFETWVYGTGVPKMSMNRAGTRLQVGGVDDAFSVDVPLYCRAANGSEQVRWIRAEAGVNSTPAPGCKLPPRSDFLYFTP